MPLLVPLALWNHPAVVAAALGLGPAAQPGRQRRHRLLPDRGDARPTSRAGCSPRCSSSSMSAMPLVPRAGRRAAARRSAARGAIAVLGALTAAVALIPTLSRSVRSVPRPASWIREPASPPGARQPRGHRARCARPCRQGAWTPTSPDAPPAPSRPCTRWATSPPRWTRRWPRSGSGRAGRRTSPPARRRWAGSAPAPSPRRSSSSTPRSWPRCCRRRGRRPAPRRSSRPGCAASTRRTAGCSATTVATSPEVAEAAELTRTAAAACDPAGRPLYAAHADLEWPVEPHLALWFGLTLLREFRGDGHIAATLSAGLTGLEALVTHTATGTGFTEPAAKATRGWSEEQWARRGRRPRRARPDDRRRRPHRAGHRAARRDRVRHRRAGGGALGRARRGRHVPPGRDRQAAGPAGGRERRLPGRGLRPRR